MNKSTVAKMIADAVKDAIRFVNTESPVAASVAAPAKAADDVQARRLAGLEKARAAKKAKAQAAVTKPAVAAPVAAVVKPAKTPKSTAAWTVKPHVTKKGAKGKIVTVGPFNAWVEEGDTEKEKALFDAINKVFRSDEAVKLAAAITG
jgi:L-2-hydroxyglutarate oxidase LhgO